MPEKKKKVIDASKRDAKTEKFKTISKRERGEVEALGAKRGPKGSAREAQEKKAKGDKKPIIRDARGNLLPGNIEIGEKPDDRNIVEKGLDIVSAPLSKPRTTFTEGIVEGGKAVAESREKIEEGDFQEAGSVALTTATSTGLLAGALLTGAGAVGALTGAEGAYTVGGIGLGAIYGIDKFVYSPGELGTWAAVDNVAGALSFQISELDNDVASEDVTEKQAKVIIDETKETIRKVRIYVVNQVQRNPKLWAASKIFNEAINTAEERVFVIERNIFG